MSKLQVIEHQNIRVLTTQQLAEVYETKSNSIKNNFMNNKDRFIEGRDYFLLKGEELKNFKNLVNDIDLVDKRTPQLYLWTERGANRHSKILDTDMAWKQFDVLEETYFKVQNEARANILPTNYKQALLQLVAQVEENEQLELSNKVKDQQIAELRPKADYCDIILKSNGLSTINAIAKDYGMSGKAMNKKLHELGVQYKQGDIWLLYSKYQDKGYTQSQTIDITRTNGRPDVTMHTKWTQKGRLFLYELLKDNDKLPLIERDM